MLSFGGNARIYLAPGVTDMRKSFNGLYALARNELEADPRQGHLFLFCNRRRDRLKALFWDGSGICIYAKRLERGRFAWPEASRFPSRTVELSRAELNLLLGGLDLRQTKRRDWLQA